MAAEGTHEAITMVSEAERIRAPLEYPEHEDLNPEDPLISEGMTTDYITGREVKDSPKERVRQRIIRALFHEYGLSPESMESDFPIPTCIPHFCKRIACERISALIFIMRCRHEQDTERDRV